jgi:hypothetical protein
MQPAAETEDLTSFAGAGRKAGVRAVEASERRKEGSRCSGDGASSPR